MSPVPERTWSRVVEQPSVDQIEPVQHFGHVGAQDGDDFGVRIVPPYGAQGRGRHDHVANPVRAEYCDLHPAFRYDSRSASTMRVVEIPGTSPSAFTWPP